MAFDYRSLLIKYIAHIKNEESIDYISRINDGWRGHVDITEEEKEELERLSNLTNIHDLPPQ